MLQDAEGSFIAHRGKIGGGREGIGKSLFFETYEGTPIEVNDGDMLNEVFLIGSLTSSQLVSKIANFIFSVNLLKISKAAKYKLNISGSFKDYYPEFFGKKKSYRVSTVVRQESRHGEVVAKLKRLLEKKNFKVMKDKNRDLYIKRNNIVDSLFEVKTDVKNQSIYSGIGQLILYKIKLPKACSLFLVIPEKIDIKVTKALNELKIKLIYYQFTRTDVKIFLDEYF